MNPIKMWNKLTNSDVDVYEMNVNDKNCLIYNPQLAGQQNGNGWIVVARKNLIPYPYAEIYKIPNMTKTKYNKAKSHLELVNAEWAATDGYIFTHSNLEKAIMYQMKLDEKNERDN